MNTKERGTLIMVMVLGAFGILWMVKAMFIPMKVRTDLLGPRFLPFWAGAAAVFFALLLIYQNVWGSRRGTGGLKEEMERVEKGFDDESGGSKIQYWRTCGVFGSLLLFILLLEHLHFFINTVMVSSLGLAFGGEPLKLRLLVYALIIGGVAYGVFIVFLQVPLPGIGY